MGGQANTGTQTTTSTPSPQAQQIMSWAMPFAGQYAAQGGTTLPGFSPIAQFTPNQVAGQQMAASQGVGAQQTAADSALKAQQFLTTGAALDPNTNPGLASSIRFAQLPIQQNLEENTLPALRSQATGVGQFGSSRDQIAEGLASRGAAQAEGTVAANLTNANYQNALDQMTRAMGLTPTVQTASITPATTMSGVGDVQQALNQSNLGYEYQKNIFPQENFLSTAQALSGIAAGLPGGTTSTNAQMSTNPSLLNMLLGGGALAGGLLGKGGIGSLGSLFGGGTAAGAAAGGSDLSSLLLAGALI